MNNVSLGKKRLHDSFRVALVGFLAGSLLMIPMTSVTALTMQPSQILPPAPGAGCSAVTFSEVTPYIYSGNLDSFDVTVSDDRYVAVATAVNHDGVSYRYITRWHNPDGSVRMHVDIPSLRMRSDVRVDITFLAATVNSSGSPITCAVNFSGTVPAIPGLSNAGHAVPIYIPIIKPGTGNGNGGTTNGTAATTTSPDSTTLKSIGLVAVTSSLGKLCTNGGSTRMWVILLVLYALFVITLLAQKIEPGDLGKEWNVVLILGIFLALLVFWYVSSICRAGPWAPAFATLIAVAGLLYSMLQDDVPQAVLLLKDGNK